IFLIALLLLVIGSFGIHFRLLSESMVGIHIDDICLKIFGLNRQGAMRVTVLLYGHVEHLIK
ncbi:hypothetical protein, partial [Vibrio injensis]|uniref:hypothetical protein n=1 Tax=Vibrio injensis TaxID=1307414 RepID=UPI00278C7C07